MTIGNLITIISIILYVIWSVYSIKDIIKNKHNISGTTILWLLLIFSSFLVITIFFSVNFWDYKLF